ncbi:MAG: hypothetical protein ACTSQE_10875 [Candidatus Heimdallarchaeaceae archaeon]
MSLSELQQLQVGKEVKYTIKVEYDTEPSSVIRSAKLLDNHIHVEIKQNTLLYQTYGKAWLIEQLDYSNGTMGSYILQHTKQKVWIVYEVVHDQKTDLLSMFKTIRRADVDTKILQYPTYVVTALVTALEIWMIWKVILKHELVFITNAGLRQIILFMMSFVLIIGFLEYYIRTNKVYIGILSVHPRRTSTYEELNFYIGNQLISGTFPVFTGKLWHKDMPDVAIGIYSETADYDETLDHFRNSLKVLTARRRALFDKILDLTGEKKKIENQISRKENEAILADADIQEYVEQEVKAFKTKKQAEINQIDIEISKYTKRAEKTTTEIQKTGTEALKLIYQTYNSEEEFTAEQIEAILFPTQKVEALRHRVAESETVASTFSRALKGSKNISNQIAQTINERVAQDVSTLKTSQFQMAYIRDEKGNIVPIAAAEEVRRKKKGFFTKLAGANWVGFIFGLIAITIGVSLFFKMLDYITEFVSVYNQAPTAQLILTSIIILASIGGIIWAVNWLGALLRPGQQQYKLL